jgi:excisionase family DNA binding protein
MSQMIERKAYSVSDFAKAYSLGKTKIYTMIAAKELRAIKLGKRTLIPASEGERLLAQVGEHV